MTRIDAKFAALKAEGKKAFVSYIMAGDPDYATSLEIMKGLPGAGVDIIELGLPFTDPMADGPTIQLAGQRALEAGQTLQKTLDMAAEFRKSDDTMENTTHLFLGIRFNCNKCHDHPFERWTQDQYYELSAFFAHVGLEADPASGKRKVGGTAVEGAKPLFEKVVDKKQHNVWPKASSVCRFFNCVFTIASRGFDSQIPVN